ncbi:hypothetical protein B0O80DRAFT_158976 [Mortierella sp. GBAus27b]|nr:hypothetical protein B0O80DRAFT_158976 [Mortierella sp. GBAus27b]
MHRRVFFPRTCLSLTPVNVLIAPHSCTSVRSCHQPPVHLMFLNTFWCSTVRACRDGSVRTCSVAPVFPPSITHPLIHSSPSSPPQPLNHWSDPGRWLVELRANSNYVCIHSARAEMVDGGAPLSAGM